MIYLWYPPRGMSCVAGTQPIFAFSGFSWEWNCTKPSGEMFIFLQYVQSLTFSHLAWNLTISPTHKFMLTGTTLTTNNCIWKNFTHADLHPSYIYALRVGKPLDFSPHRTKARPASLSIFWSSFPLQSQHVPRTACVHSSPLHLKWYGPANYHCKPLPIQNTRTS